MTAYAAIFGASDLQLKGFSDLPEDQRAVPGCGRHRPQFRLNEGDTASEAQHVAFTARNRAEVDAFYKAAMAAGGRDNGKPGLRRQYHAGHYRAFVLDPDGNNIEAVCHAPA